MTNVVLTEAESNRISWAAYMLGIAREELLRATCQVKSFLADRPSLVRTVRARLNAGFDDEGRAARALYLSVKGAMGGAMAGFGGGLGTALSSALATMGIVVAAELLAVIIVVVGIVMLFTSILELHRAWSSLAHLQTAEDAF